MISQFIPACRRGFKEADWTLASVFRPDHLGDLDGQVAWRITLMIGCPGGSLESLGVLDDWVDKWLVGVFDSPSLTYDSDFPEGSC